jgi:DNA polymerase-3 subunit delta'
MNANQDVTLQTPGQIVGHQWALELLMRQAQANRLPQALLLTGPPNVGKSSLARFFAQYLDCQAETRPCGHCISCRKVVSGNHPDIRILDQDDQPLKIDQVRELQRELALSPAEGAYRVAVFCNFERATPSAANALLKTLEEPAPQVVMILTAAEPGSLLPTIVSRCQILKLRPIPKSEVLAALRSRWQAEPEQAELLTQLAAGRLGWAARALTDETFLERRSQCLDDLLDLLRLPRAERLAYAQQFSRDTVALKEALTLWLMVWRDLLLLKSNGQTKITNLDWQGALQQIAQCSTIAQISQMITRLHQALYYLERNVNPRLILEVVLLKLPGYTELDRTN